MKMQEVVLNVRERVPVLEDEWSKLSETLDALADIARDYRRAETPAARDALADAMADRAAKIGMHADNLALSVRELADMNRAYTARIGPRKPKDAPGQQMLPGFEDEGGTPATKGGTTNNFEKAK